MAAVMIVECMILIAPGAPELGIPNIPLVNILGAGNTSDSIWFAVSFDSLNIFSTKSPVAVPVADSMTGKASPRRN